jgi:hypothetical protein
MAARAKKKISVRLTQVKLFAEFLPKFTGVQFPSCAYYGMFRFAATGGFSMKLHMSDFL